MRRDGWKKTFASASKRNNFKDNMFQRLLTWLTLPQIRQQQKSNQFTYGVGKPHSLKLSCIRKSFHFASILLQRHEERRENSDLCIHSKFRHFIFGLEKLLASGGGGAGKWRREPTLGRSGDALFWHEGLEQCQYLIKIHQSVGIIRIRNITFACQKFWISLMVTQGECEPTASVLWCPNKKRH